MKQLFFIIILFFIPIQSNAQQLTIGGMEGQTLFIGTANHINYQHPDYSKLKMTLVNDNCRFYDKKTCYCSKEGTTTLLIRDTLNNLIDSFSLEVKKMEVFGLFLKLNDGSLIKPINHISTQQIQQFNSLYYAHNVPWINLNVDAFDFTLLQNDEVFSFTIKKNKIPNDLKKLLPNIKKGTKIYIDTIKVRMPGDCNNRFIKTFDLNVN